MLRFLLTKAADPDHSAIKALQYNLFYREEKPENLALTAYLMEKPVDQEKVEKTKLQLPSLP